MEWDRKWKTVSGFTPCDLISVIMGFMSFPSRRPHTTSHVPGHTHTSGHLFHSLAQRQTHSTCVFVYLTVLIFSHSLHQPFTYLITHKDTCTHSVTDTHWPCKKPFICNNRISLSKQSMHFCNEITSAHRSTAVFPAGERSCGFLHYISRASDNFAVRGKIYSSQWASVW